jgi:hypothetical protein
MKHLGEAQIEAAFKLLGERLHSESLGSFRLVICGGASLISMSLISRATRDVDVVALMTEENALVSPDPIPDDLARMARIVAEDLDLDENWLNTGPKDIFHMGLPEGFSQRLTRRDYGANLTVFFSGRLDQIHFKVYAAADQGAGKHLADLLSLNPTDLELEQAAKWTLTHDVSKDFHNTLKDMFMRIGRENVAERI